MPNTSPANQTTTATTLLCACGCGAAAIVTIQRLGFASRPCAQRRYRRIIAEARRGDRAAIAHCEAEGWNINANIGGGRRSMRVASAPRVQRFGVEIEFQGSPTEVVRHAQTIGIDIREENYNHTTRTWWKVVADGSCGWELVSPVLTGEEGFEQVRKACAALRASGARVSVMCGLHVHLDVSDLNLDQMKRAVAGYCANQARIDEIISRSRRGNRYCLPWTPGELAALQACQDLRAIPAMQSTRYKALNLQCFPRYNTIEFRQHQGTHNAEKITRWIGLCVALLERARREVVPPFSDLHGFLHGLSLDDETQGFFTERAMELA